MEKLKPGRKKFVGIVVKKSGQKTIKVEVERTTFHKLYKKYIKKRKKFLVHDEKNQASIGDKVQIIESRPISKLKKWRLQKIIQKATS
jgi:small subunit ribosomal protein S17